MGMPLPSRRVPRILNEASSRCRQLVDQILAKT
jgi:hypothetical protein